MARAGASPRRLHAKFLALYATLVVFVASLNFLCSDVSREGRSSDHGFLPQQGSARDGRLRELFDAALAQTTAILYRRSPADLEYWRSQRPPLVYIYDTIADEYSDVATVSACVDERHGVQPGALTNATGVPLPPWRNCRWRPAICESTVHRPYTRKQGEFRADKHNFNQDVAYLARFVEAYPAAYKTRDPTRADVFLVPFPILSFCLCHRDFLAKSDRCRADFDRIERDVAAKLVHRRNRSYAARHLFLYGADRWKGDKKLDRLTKGGLALSLGPVHAANPTSGELAVPYICPSADLQPRAVHDRPRAWWTRDRPFALGAAFGTSRGLSERQEFLARAKEFVGTSLGGKNHSIRDLRKGRGRMSRINFSHLYRNSTFCLILKGDFCAQKRFFEALLNGCIPVVPTYRNGTHGIGTHVYDETCDVASTYPFSRGSLTPGDGGGVDMLSDVVLTFEGEKCGYPCMREPMKRLLSNWTALQERQLRLREYALLSSFGLTDASYGYPDAFMAFVVALRHKVWHLRKVGG